MSQPTERAQTTLVAVSSWSVGNEIISFSVLEHDPGFLFEPGVREHALHVRLDRIGQVSRQDPLGRQQPIHPAATLFIPAQRATTWRVGSTFKRLIIRLQPDFLHALAAQQNLDLPDEWPELSPALDPVVEHYTGLVLHEVEQGEAPSGPFLEAFARLIGLHVLKRYLRPPQLLTEETPQGLGPVQREQIDQYVRRTLPGPIVMEEVATAVGLSHYQFLRLVKRSTGDTPQQYVLKLRIDMAKKMLRESDVSLVDIALTLGFSSQSHFTNTFRSYTQYTPKAYRERADLI